MNDEPTKDLATRAFQKRVLDEFAAVRREQAVFADELRALRTEQAESREEVRVELSTLRQEMTEVRNQQSAMAQNIARVDERLTSLEQRVDERLKETRPIWEAVQVQIQRLGEKLDAILLDFYELRGELKIHGRRLGELERRVIS